MLPTGRCIVPVIKEKAWLDTVRQQLSQYESDPEILNASLDFAWEDFNDELIILFAEDGSETMRYLMRYEVTIDREQAINNLKQILPEFRLKSLIQAQTLEKLPLSPQGVLMSPV